MLDITKFDNIYLFRPFVDFRKGISGLCGVIQDDMSLNPFENYLFMFCNTKRDKVKAIYWDETGFALWYKCLQLEKYKWPEHLEENIYDVNVQMVKEFLAGLNPWQMSHRKLNFSYI